MSDIQKQTAVKSILEKLSETYPELKTIQDAIADRTVAQVIIADPSSLLTQYSVTELEELILKSETLPENLALEDTITNLFISTESTQTNSLTLARGGNNLLFTRIDGTENDDLIVGTRTNDLIFALGGNDIVIALAGNDIVLGGDGNDTIFGGPSLPTDIDNDILLGGNGNDLFYSGFGNDNVIGGNGIDTVDYRFLNQSITLKPTGIIDKGTAGVDSLFEIEEIVANPTQSNTIDASTATGNTAIKVDLSTGNLTVVGVFGTNLNFTAKNFSNVIGTNNNDTIAGSSGNNKIIGGGGDDNILGSVGKDFIDGGLGFDTADYSNLKRGITLKATGIVEKGELGTDQLFQVERIIGAASIGTFARSVNTIDGSDASGTASLKVDLSQNKLEVLGTSVGDLKFTVENFSNVTGTSQNDFITGNNSNNQLIGGRGNDAISGLAGKDTLIGVNPSSLRSGFGEVDVLTGGADEDLFVLGDRSQAYYLGSGSEDFAIVTDFQSGIDKIQLNGSINNYSFLGNNSIFRLDANSFDLVGTVANGFVSSDFVFV